ncbi:MAG: phosphate signaling complex protein PhoU [Peptococcaceae bacterium]|nr:phosphate signaling complex protein PhoU [Peptococcaceae bacterium]
MRSRFDEQLVQLNNTLLEMGALIEHAINESTKALIAQDAESAHIIIEGDEEIDNKEREIESLCLKLLLHQQPVANDLRQISTALKMITDMERIGDHASDIAQLSVYLSTQPYINKLDHIQEMAKATTRMLRDTIDAFVKKDLQLAKSVILYDDVVDELYYAIKKGLISLVHEDVQNGEQAFDLMQIAKYYERIGDHAVNLAEWVIFSITGVHKNQRVL